jgi:hypothetical protein
MPKKVMILCIAKKWQVLTGITMDPDYFATAQPPNNYISYPRFLGMHGWSKSDAFLE